MFSKKLTLIRLLLSIVSICVLTACTQPRSVPTPVSATVSPTTTCQYQHTATGDVLPDPRCTPGATNVAVTQETLSTTICKPGWTATIRPPVSFTEPLKLQQMRAYGNIDANGKLLSASGFEEDHLIPLELGGAASESTNLWPEPTPSPNPKDRIENALNKLVCSGKLDLAVAQHKIATDWTTAVP